MPNRIDPGSENSPIEPPKFAVVSPRSLDCAALAALLRAESAQVVLAETNLNAIAPHSHNNRINVLLITAGFHHEQVRTLIKEFVLSKPGRHVAYLDHDITPLRAIDILHFVRTSYFTRHDNISHILAEVREKLPHAMTPLHPSAVTSSARARQMLVEEFKKHDAHRLMDLTERETQILRLIASGQTVNDIARTLGLAQSTVDNHKSRIMKKLDVHKMGQLTLVAVRAGLIDPWFHSPPAPRSQGNKK